VIPFRQPRIVIAALKGGGGKTILSLGLVAAWREKGLKISPFKKGPDFIDAGWLAFASGRPCYNLDPFLMTREQVLESFILNSADTDLSLVEGNRGLYDGLDVEGLCSTAEVAKLIKSPVLIVVDVTMTTRTIAALIKGCQTFDPELNISGVILNRVAGIRQETLIRAAIEKYCGIPVVGSVPRLKGNTFPERHMGLVPYQERDSAEKAVSWARTAVEQNIEMDEIWRIARNAEAIDQTHKAYEIYEIIKDTQIFADSAPLRIGYISDRSFWFYYPENLEALRRIGALLVKIDALSHKELPRIDALYIGGGFPETQADALSKNESFRCSLKYEIEKGLPVYAECGGFMYLGKSLLVDGKTYPMVGSLPFEFILRKRPQGHGYTVLEVTRPNPYYPVGAVLKGHEFHYSQAVLTGKTDIDTVFKVKRGHGVDGEVDGICMKNLLATYTHIHARGNRFWAKGLVNAARNYQRKNDALSGCLSFFPQV
jgi:cobyrinic acid a,c-diamide synthase